MNVYVIGFIVVGLVRCSLGGLTVEFGTVLGCDVGVLSGGRWALSGPAACSELWVGLSGRGVGDLGTSKSAGWGRFRQAGGEVAREARDAAERAQP